MRTELDNNTRKHNISTLVSPVKCISDRCKGTANRLDDERSYVGSDEDY